MINSVVLVGRLTADPELKTTPSNVSVTTFSIAVQRSFARQGEERQTDFINVVAWRQTAEFISRYFQKGNMIGIEGAIQTRKYTDKDGNNRTAFEVVANQAHFVESKNSSSNYAAPAAQQNQSQPQSFDSGNFNDFSEVPADDDELPF